MNRSRIANSVPTILSIVALATLLAPMSAFAAGDAAAGKDVYKTNCASCHGDSGKGDGPVGQVLQPPPRNFAVGDFKFDADKDGKVGTDADLTLVITKGAGAFGGNQMMAAWGGMLSEAGHRLHPQPEAVTTAAVANCADDEAGSATSAPLRASSFESSRHPSSATVSRSVTRPGWRQPADTRAPTRKRCTAVGNPREL